MTARAGHKETDQIIRTVERFGWRSERSKGHVKLYAPTGQMVVTGCTPSDRRSIANTIAIIRRIDPRPFPRAGSKEKA